MKGLHVTAYDIVADVTYKAFISSSSCSSASTFQSHEVMIWLSQIAGAPLGNFDRPIEANVDIEDNS